MPAIVRRDAASGQRGQGRPRAFLNDGKQKAIPNAGKPFCVDGMTGAELRAARKAAKISQADLAKSVGVSRDTVQYWEAKPLIGRWGAWRLMAEALGLRDYWSSNARAGGWGVSWSEQEDARIEALFAANVARAKEGEAQAATHRRVICGAKTRKGGQCRNKSEPGKRRCKFHGGKSTGPKTPEGKALIAEAQRRRWARVKAAGSVEQISSRFPAKPGDDPTRDAACRPKDCNHSKRDKSGRRKHHG